MKEKVFLLNTFSPSMIEEGQALIKLVDEDWFTEQLRKGFISAVSHKNTAEILSKRLDVPVEFNRENIQLRPYDIALIAVPQVRFDFAREYSSAEIQSAKFKFYLVMIS